MNQDERAAIAVSKALKDKAMFNMFYDELRCYDSAFSALHELHVAQKRFYEEKRK